jgi:hypothetical protein
MSGHLPALRKSSLIYIEKGHSPTYCVVNYNEQLHRAQPAREHEG